MMSDRTIISYKEMADSTYGLVLRSSAIFYCRKGDGFETTISFVNYWMIKRAMSVMIVASTRDMDGNLIKREEIKIGPQQVINYRPKIGIDKFEGSVEIEVFALQNMVIPYAAMVGIYRSPKGISMVHSYARAYSRYEVEERRTINRGEEACWSLRDNVDIQSFCVFHNGPREVAAQTSALHIVNRAGEEHKIEIPIPALPPYASTKLYPSDYFENLVRFLGGETGQASLSFILGEGFTRMLVGHERRDGTDFQVTHSNFNYSAHGLDFVPHAESTGFMKIPACGAIHKSAVVYAHSTPGHYRMLHGARIAEFHSGEVLVEPLNHGGDILEFRRLDGPMPSRLVTGLVVTNDKGLIPAECSLGVLTALQPRRKLQWTVCAADGKRRSKVVGFDLPEIFGGMPPGSTIDVNLYSAIGSEPLTITLNGSALPRLEQGIDVRELFPNAEGHLAGDFGYLTFSNEYGGLTFYSLMENDSGSVSLEHSF